MATNFPSSLDTSTTLPQPSGTSLLTSPDHAGGHTSLSQAAIAIEQKLGIGAGTPTTTNKLLVATGNGQSGWSGTVNNIVIGTSQMTGGTLTGGLVSGGTANNQVIGTPAITGGTQTAVTSVTRYIGSAVYSGTVSGTTTLNLSLATRHLINMPNSAGAVTLALSNVTVNQPFIVEALRGTAGLGTIVWFAGITWLNNGTSAPTQGTTASRKDSFGFIPTGTAAFDGYIVGLGG